MKKLIVLGLVASLSINMIGCTKQSEKELVNNPPEQIEEETEVLNDEIEKSHITDIVISFGSKLQLVSLLVPEDDLADSMKEHYGEFVSEELMDEWVKNPAEAPGRLVSSPWPDRIEVEDVEKVNDNLYKVKGNIIEVTNTEDNVATVSIGLEVEKIDDRWIISSVDLGE